MARLDDYEYEGEYEDEYEDEDEYEYEFEDEYEDEFELELEMENPFEESEEMELAAELLSVSDEYELEQFLGKLFKKAWRGVRSVARSPVGRALGGALKKVAKRALPIAGRAIGTYFGGPAGGALGSRAGSMAGKIFGLELEGLSPEDQEFESARRFVRLAGAAAKKAAQEPVGTPKTIARKALIAAAEKHAPGLLTGTTSRESFYGASPARRYYGRRSPGTYSRRYSGTYGRRYPSTYGRSNAGRWMRRGKNIILMGA